MTDVITFIKKQRKEIASNQHPNSIVSPFIIFKFKLSIHDIFCMVLLRVRTILSFAFDILFHKQFHVTPSFLFVMVYNVLLIICYN